VDGGAGGEGGEDVPATAEHLACHGSLGDLLVVGEIVEYLAHVLKRLALIEISSGCLFLARGVLGVGSDLAGGIGAIVLEARAPKSPVVPR